MPPPPRIGGPPVTNIRNTSSPHWRGWLKPESRCLVPANSFAEYAPEPNPETGKKDVVWFALNDDRPLRYYEPLRHPRAPSLSLTGLRLVIADHALGLPVLRTLSLCTCRRHYPAAAPERIASLISSRRISLPR
jgi:hypothetical protein